MRAADPILRGNAELGWFDADVAAAYLLAIDVNCSRSTVKGYGHMMPAAGRQRRGPVDDLLGSAVFDRKTDEAVCPVLRRQEHVVCRIRNRSRRSAPSCLWCPNSPKLLR